MPDRILFFRIWANPPIAASVEKLLLETFPDYEVKTITLWEHIKTDKKVLFSNGLAVLKEYGLDILLGRLKFKVAFFRTTYLFNYVRALARKFARQEKDLCFTFQLQSIFDTHIEGIPNFVYTDHTHLANMYYADYTRVRLFSAAWIACEKTIYDHANLVFTRSSNISRSLIEQYGMPEEKVICIYAGANTPLPDIDLDRKDYDAQNILFVGLDWERKGGPDLVRAFKQVFPRHPQASLIIVGNQIEDDHPGIQSFARVPLEDLHGFYRQATIFAMPSYNEPFGIVFVEAMACALPILATRIGAIPDMVRTGQNGYLVEPGDIDGLTEALEMLLQSEERRRRFGRHSWDLSQQRYNWPAVGALLRSHILKNIGGNE